jgi:hypothetical protein
MAQLEFAVSEAKAIAVTSRSVAHCLVRHVLPILQGFFMTSRLQHWKV